MLTPNTQLLAPGYGASRRVVGSAVEAVSMGVTAWATRGMGKGLVSGKQAICHTRESICGPIMNDAASRDFVAQPPR